MKRIAGYSLIELMLVLGAVGFVLYTVIRQSGPMESRTAATVAAADLVASADRLVALTTKGDLVGVHVSDVVSALPEEWRIDSFSSTQRHGLGGNLGIAKVAFGGVSDAAVRLITYQLSPEDCITFVNTAAPRFTQVFINSTSATANRVKTPGSRTVDSAAVQRLCNLNANYATWYLTL